MGRSQGSLTAKVECFFNKIKGYRGIATRYDKKARASLAAIKLVAARLYLESYESATWFEQPKLNGSPPRRGIVTGRLFCLPQTAERQPPAHSATSPRGHRHRWRQ